MSEPAWIQCELDWAAANVPKSHYSRLIIEKLVSEVRRLRRQIEGHCGHIAAACEVIGRNALRRESVALILERRADEYVKSVMRLQNCSRLTVGESLAVAEALREEAGLVRDNGDGSLRLLAELSEMLEKCPGCGAKVTLTVRVQ